MNKLLNNLLGMYKQAKLNKKAEQQNLKQIFEEAMGNREPIIETANGVFYFEPKGDKIVFGTATNVGISQDYVFDYDFDMSFDQNIQGMAEEVLEKEGYYTESSKRTKMKRKAGTIEQQINDKKYSIDTENDDANKLLEIIDDIVYDYDVIKQALDMTKNQKEDEFSIVTLSPEKDKVLGVKYIKKDEVYDYKPNQNEYALVMTRDTGFADTDYQLQPMIMVVRSWNEGRKFYATKKNQLNKKAEEDLIAIGWGLYTYENNIKANAEDDGRATDREFWNKINNDIAKVESWFLKEGYKKFFTKVRDEGHGKDSELGGTAFVTEEQLKNFVDRAEGMNGSFTLTETSGALEFPIDYDETIFFELVIFVDEKILDDLNIESKRVSKNKKFSSKAKAMRKKAFRKLCLKRAFHKTAGEFEEMMKLKSTDPKLISYLAKEFGVEESTVSQYTDVSENAEELYNILEQQANKYGYEWDKFEYDEYGDRIDEDDFRGDPDDLDKAVEYLKNNIDKSMFKFEYVGQYEDNYLTFSVNEKLIPIEKPIIHITNYTKNYDISFFVESQKAKEEDKAEGIYTEDNLSILIRRTSNEILNEIVNYVNVELPKKIEEQNKKQSSKTKAVRKQAIRTFDQAIKDDLLKGNKTWEDAGKDIRDSGWSSFSLDKGETIEMLKLTEEEIAKIDSLQQTAKEKKQIAEEYTKQYYAGKFDLETLHDKLVKIFGDIGTAFEWLRDNDEKIKRNSSTKKQAEGKKYYAVAESGTNFGSNDNKEDLKEEIRDFVVAHKDNFEKKEKIYLKESDTDKTIEEIIVRDILTPYGSKKWVIVATKKQAEEKAKPILVDAYYYKYLEDIDRYVREKIEDRQYAYIEYPKDEYERKITVDDIKDKLNFLAEHYFTLDRKTKKGDKIVITNHATGEELGEKEYTGEKLAKRQNKLFKQATIKHENGVYNVYSESGKCLGKGYKTKEEAEKRLKQVEYFKHKNASVIKKAKNLSEIDGDAEFMSDLEIGNGMPYNSDDYDYFEVYKIHAKNPKDTYNNKYVVVSDDGSILAVREKEEDIIEITYDDMLQELRWRRLSNRKTQPNKRTSLKQVVISKMAKSLKDIPDSVKKNILSDLVYVILTGKGSFAYKTVAKKLETIIKELGYGDKLKANEDGSLPTNEIVELISKEPKAMELAGKFANITRAF